MPNAQLLAVLPGLLCTCLLARAADPALEDLVARLDRIRIPSQPCAAVIEISRPDRPGEPVQVFKSFTRVSGNASARQTSALLVCTEPPKDAGKRLLFTADSCWFHDPKAKNPVRISPGQLWSQPASADSPNWHLASDFTATVAGREEITCGDSAKRACTVVDFVPRSASLAAPALMRCWIDDKGRYWRAEHYTAGKKLIKMIDNVTYAGAAGTPHVATMRIRAGSETAEVRVTGMTGRESPDEWFDPRSLPRIQL